MKRSISKDKQGNQVFDDKLENCINTFIEQEKLPNSFRPHALKWFNPVIEKLKLNEISANQTLFIGVNGSQGSGKSTFSQFLTSLINQTTQYCALTLSLDDFYLNQIEREKLAKKQHELFRTRGVPGTHDTAQMKAVLLALKNGKTCYLPRFDKGVDNPIPIELCEKQEGRVDIVFLEGWCWGVRAVDETELVAPVNDMESHKDAFMLWRKYSNAALKTEYEPLYSLFDYWIMLKAPSFNCVYKWRCEQEEKLKTKNPNAPGIMSKAQILDFIQHYQRLTERCLSALPNSFDLVFELDSSRNIKQAVYK